MGSVEYGKMTQPPSIGQPMHWKPVPHSKSGFLNMADVWHVKIFGQLLRTGIKEPNNKAELKRVIIIVWKEVNTEKLLCKKGHA